jgi:hypothetical protein
MKHWKFSSDDIKFGKTPFGEYEYLPITEEQGDKEAESVFSLAVDYEIGRFWGYFLFVELTR